MYVRLDYFFSLKITLKIVESPVVLSFRDRRYLLVIVSVSNDRSAIGETEALHN